MYCFETPPPAFWQHESFWLIAAAVVLILIAAMLGTYQAGLRRGRARLEDDELLFVVEPSVDAEAHAEAIGVIQSLATAEMDLSAALAAVENGALLRSVQDQLAQTEEELARQKRLKATYFRQLKRGRERWRAVWTSRIAEIVDDVAGAPA